jgi:hypothetical protein
MMSPTDFPFSGPDHAIVRIADGETQVFLSQAETMRDALVIALRGSSLEERDHLLTLTEKAPIWIDPDGIVHIGPWLLQPRGHNLVLTYRPPSDAPVIRAYAATFARQGSKWLLQDLREERIRR